MNAVHLTGIQNDNRKAKVILTAGKGNIVHPVLFMKSCMKIVHSVKK